MSPPTHLDSRLVIQPQQAAAKQADPGWANRIVGAPANAPLVVRLKSSRTMIGEKDYEDGTRRKRAIAPLAASGLEFECVSTLFCSRLLTVEQRVPALESRRVAGRSLRGGAVAGRDRLRVRRLLGRERTCIPKVTVRVV